MPPKGKQPRLQLVTNVGEPSNRNRTPKAHPTIDGEPDSMSHSRRPNVTAEINQWRHDTHQAAFSDPVRHGVPFPETTELAPFDWSKMHVNGDLYESMHAEIRIHILTYLPAAQLFFHSKTVSPFRKDINEREAELVRKVTDRKKADFQVAAARIEYPKDDSMFESLKHWLDHKRMWTFQELPESTARTEDFVYHYVERCGGYYNEDVPKLSEYLQNLIVRYDHQAWMPPVDHEEALRLASGYVPARLMTNQWGNPNDIEIAHIGELGPPPLSSWRDRPLRALTNTCWRYGTGPAVLDERTFLAMFNLPAMPQSGPIPGPAMWVCRHFVNKRGARLAYCTYEDQVARMDATFHEVLTRQAWNRPPMNALKQASILDDVFVW
ncbi:hypothetical protein LTR09_010860 [Extremus antarcticus]|uniref:Uncharacterized protein n=1 Tax=Extremus antarcticus TaxID=702011 RepID=A0AAJ0G819_9PEZI|nr:hypothetical protein LTR09_010860 [Extremus antarcticus]